MLELLKRLLGLQPAPPAISDEQWARVEGVLPFLDFLDAATRQRLRTLALQFLRQKQFHGAHGLALNDDMLLTIALQACLPVLNAGLHAYQGWVGVVIYPGDFIIPRQAFDEAGVVHEYDDEVLGEAWEGGPVLLSWFEGAAQPAGVNVVIHEFAHKLDMDNGDVDGLPTLPPGMSRKQWADVFSVAYDDFCAEVDTGQETVIDPYGAEHPGEFFAVVSEAFFETPLTLRTRFPDVYTQLSMLYGLDPASGEERLRQEGR
jgi:MtfA peptidase